MLAGQQRELGVEADLVAGLLAQLDPVLVEEVGESELDLEQAQSHPDAVVRPSSKGEVRHGRVLGPAFRGEAFRIEALRIRPVL